MLTRSSSSGEQENLHLLRKAYHQLIKAVDKKTNAISKRYDGLTGSRWLVTVVELFSEGYISEDDIKDFSDETRALIKMMMRRL